MTLYKSLVRSHLEYCCPLWHPYKVQDIQTLENVQRYFTKRIFGMSRVTYWDRLKLLRLMSLQRRRESYILIHMWKILYLLVPNDIGVEFRSPSRLGVQAVIPRLIRDGRLANQMMFEKSFAVIGPKLWNGLPAELTIIESQNSFKNQLTDFLLDIRDEPPVVGYPRRDNSLAVMSLRGGHQIDDLQ